MLKQSETIEENIMKGWNNDCILGGIKCLQEKIARFLAKSALSF